MIKRILAMMFLLTGIVTFASMTVRAQAASEADKVDAYIEPLRSELRMNKAIVIREQLTLTWTEADAFMPCTNVMKLVHLALNDAKIALIKDHAENYGTTTNTKAKYLANRTLDLDDKRPLLRKKFYQAFERVLNEKAAAQSVQLDRCFDLLMDLQIASEVPLVN